MHSIAAEGQCDWAERTPRVLRGLTRRMAQGVGQERNAGDFAACPMQAGGCSPIGVQWHGFSVSCWLIEAIRGGECRGGGSPCAQPLTARIPDRTPGGSFQAKFGEDVSVKMIWLLVLLRQHRPPEHQAQISHKYGRFWHKMLLTSAITYGDWKDSSMDLPLASATSECEQKGLGPTELDTGRSRFLLGPGCDRSRLYGVADNAGLIRNDETQCPFSRHSGHV